MATQAQESASNEIVAEGFSKTKIKPDLVTFTLTVQKTDSSERRVIEKLNLEVEQLVQALHQIGIPDSLVKIADYNVSRNFNERHKIRYSGSNILKLEMPVDYALINRLYSQIQSSRLSDLDISYETSVSDKLEKNVRSKLVQEAIADAKANGENIAKSLNLKIVSVKRVYKYGPAPEGKAEIVMEKYTPPRVINDEEVRANTSFEKFKVTEVELNENITVIFGISQPDYK